MFINEDLPAPEGPMMAVSSPEQNFPEIHFRIFFTSTKISYNGLENKNFRTFLAFWIKQHNNNKNLTKSDNQDANLFRIKQYMMNVFPCIH